MAEFSINVDLSEVLAGFPAVDKEVFPLLHHAVRAVADQVRSDWQESVARAKLWSGEKRAYIDSFSVRETGDFSVEVVASYKHAHAIETGRPAYDQKRMLDSSLKVRVSAKGKRYLIIPFRHNIPGASGIAKPMPQSVYDEAKNLAPSKIVGHGRRPSGTGAYGMQTREPLTVRERKYEWGSRLDSGMARKLRRKHKSDPYAGMVRFESGSGGEKRSTYLTFRVMSEGSRGWIIPAKPGLWLARDVAQATQPKAERAFQEAISRTLDNVG